MRPLWLSTSCPEHGLEAANDLAVDVGGGLLRVRREGAAIIVKPQEIRRLVDALVEGAARVVDEQV